MNMSDSERIIASLETIGFQHVSNWRHADLVIFNTCKIRQRAEDRLFGQQENILAIREKNPKIVFAATGCMVKKTSFIDNLDDARDPLFKKMRVLNFVFRIEDAGKLPDMLKRYFRRINPGNFCPDPHDYFSITPKVTRPFQVLVPIMNGCNKRCSYCVVPFTRGRECSRDSLKIVSEINQHVTRGAVEVTLLGQNVNSYLDKSGINFPQLLELVHDISGLRRIRFSTSHPYDFSDELISVMAKSQKICKELHLPVQSGDDAILKLMNRHYTAGSYTDIVHRARAAMPEITISTDIIVGFPGETREAFEHTIELYKNVRFDLAYISQFSPRKGTAACVMPNQVSETEKQWRWHSLNQLQTKITKENNQAYIGKELVVLVEEITKGPAGRLMASGRTEGFKYAQFAVDEQGAKRAITQRVKAGDFVTIKIERALTWVLQGKISEMRKGCHFKKSAFVRPSFTAAK